MEKTIRKIFVVGCLLTGLGVTLTAAGSYADDPSTSTNPAYGDNATSTGAQAQTKFSLNVEKAITLNSVSFKADRAEGTEVPEGVTDSTILASPAGVQTGTLSAGVLSNSGYTISMIATPLASSDTGTEVTIPFMAENTPPSANFSSWGVKKKGADDSTYKSIATTQPMFSSPNKTGAAGLVTSFTVGVGVAKTQAQGTYTSTVTITVANI